MGKFLEIRQLSRRFGDLAAVQEVSFAIEAGEFFTLVGPSGCCKSTLLRIIAGLEAPDAGEILLDGLSLAGTPPEARPFNMVFQSYARFPHLSGAENVAFALRLAEKPREAVSRRVQEVLEQVGLADKAALYPHQLSGGQRPRVANGRAIADLPRMLLLDEPLAALDAKPRKQMRRELLSLQKNLGITFLMVTHSQADRPCQARELGQAQAGIPRPLVRSRQPLRHSLRLFDSLARLSRRAHRRPGPAPRRVGLDLRAKPHWAAFSNSTCIKDLAVGNIRLAHGHSNDLFRAAEGARERRALARMWTEIKMK